MRVGVGKANLEFKDDLVLFGYGPKGGRGYNGKGEEKDTLQVRALWIASGKEKLLLLSYDMVSGSQVVEELLLEALKLGKHQLLMVGTHTHSAPGRYFGNIYDLAQWPAGLDMTVVDELVRGGKEAGARALANVREATVSVAQRVLWQAGRNRSYAPFLSNFEHGVAGWPEELKRELDIKMPGDLPVEEQAVDPRMTVLTFRDATGKPFASWASWCCHPATSRPGERRPYHRDWPGMAVDAVENQAELGVELAIIHQRANGDVTSLPVGAAEQADPLGRMAEIAAKVVEVWADAVREVPATSSDVFTCRRWDLDPTAEAPDVYNGDLPSWEMGAAVTGGSEEVPAGLVTRWFGEARVLPWRKGRQARKLPDPTTLLAKTWLARAVLKNPRFRLSPSARHPFWFLQFGTHVVFASPFEQTTYAARTAERVLLDALELAGAGNVTVSPLGLASDYAGYLTTPKEFALQHYEGGHTLYGKRQLEVCIDIWIYLVQQANFHEGATATATVDWLERIDNLADEGLQESTAQGEAAKALVSDAVQEAERVGAARVGRQAGTDFAYRNVRVNVAKQVPTWIGQHYLYKDTVGGGPTRVVGECWGMSRLSHPAPGGTLLRTGSQRTAERVEWHHGEDVGAYYLECRLGATFAEAAANASIRDSCLPNLPGFSGLTVAGCIGVGGHGSGLHLGPLASMVRRIQFGHPETGQAEGGCTYRRGEELFELALCHLGRLGPVLAIDLDVVGEYDIFETRTVVEVPKTGVNAWATLLNKAIEAQECPRDVHSAEIWIAPYPDDNGYATTLGVRRRAKPKPIPETLPLTNHNPALVGLGYLASVLTNQLDQVAHKIPALLRAAVRLTAHDGAHMSGTDGLDFGSANSIPAASIELAIDLANVEHAAAALHALVGKLNELAQENPPLHLLSPIGIRFTDAAPGNSLAPQAGRARTMHVEVPTFNHASCHADEILAPVQRFMAAEHKARPHWGQRIYLNAAELAPLWPEEARRAFAKLVEIHDPNGRFANPLLDEMLEV